MSNSKESEPKTIDALVEAEKAAERFLPKIRRGRLERLIIYEVSDSELETLAQGSPSSIYLNFAVFLLSVSAFFFIALLTTTISIRVFIVFVVITVLGAIIGLVLLFLWLKTRIQKKDLIKTIKDRLPEENLQD